MRIVIDLQAAQSSGSRNRGIGRYSLSLALAMIRNRGEHEIFIALSGLFPETIDPIRQVFLELLPPENICIWNAIGPVSSLNVENDWRRKAAELAREAFLANLRPDIVHVSSLFEGLSDDAVTSIGKLSSNILTAVTLYDLIPYIHRKHYLKNHDVKYWYLNKLEQLQCADLLLAISESSRSEGINYLGLSDECIVNISTDADLSFRLLDISEEVETQIRARYSLSRPFLMYTGGIDHRKNIEGLIIAFSKLPSEIRNAYQLAIVCSAQPEAKHMLETLAKEYGLLNNEVVLTGFVPEDDLIVLYNLCTLFVFPSWHEGFGLPALEAMRCGAPVIAANTSSLPEVVGWEEALFDPHSEEAIATLIQRALLDETFRIALIQNSKRQSERFSWDHSAQRAIQAMEYSCIKRKAEIELNREQNLRLKLAYISPLPPAKTGIADYSAELLLELAQLYDIDVIIAQDQMPDNCIKMNCKVRSVQWFRENFSYYDRVIYHFGNSPFHEHMFELLKVAPGIVVLHDFFLSGVVAHREYLGLKPEGFVCELYNSHGYVALLDRTCAIEPLEVAWKYPCSLGVIQDSLGVIVHSAHSLQLAEKWYGKDCRDWSVIPLMRDSNIIKKQVRKALGFSEDDFLVCAFGLLGPTKLNHRLLQAWVQSSLSKNKHCHLVFVGENHPGDYGYELLSMIESSDMKNRIHITGWTDIDIFRQYLASADIGVQLRTLSRGETSAAVLDCMNYGLATIVNSNGSMADLDNEAVWKLPNEFSDKELIEALEVLWQNESSRCQLGKAARSIILRDHDPKVCAGQYQSVIEDFYRMAASDIHALPSAIAALGIEAADDATLMRFADSIAQGFPKRNRKCQLLVDISTLVHCDSKSGIQRVVRSILHEWLSNPPDEFRVEPVYALTNSQGYRYARKFTLDFLDCTASLNDEWVEYTAGDIFVGLDLQHHVVISQKTILQQMRQRGVEVKFIIYDLLPVLLPHVFISEMESLHDAWLRVVTQMDGAICISKAVADELHSWIQKNTSIQREQFNINWFHLGADVENSLPSKGLPIENSINLDVIRNQVSFLMVGTVEPRKGQLQVLDAFDELWQIGCEINLVIIGKQGWLVDDLVERLRHHPAKEKRLYWLEGISDEYLEKIYDASTCLIAASYGEGFGLPLIEAAQHKIPMIIRDIPVFREVAGDYAFYFKAEEPNELALAIQKWLKLYEENKHPSSEYMPWLTWEQSANQLLKIILDQP